MNSRNRRCSKSMQTRRCCVRYPLSSDLASGQTRTSKSMKTLGKVCKTYSQRCVLWKTRWPISEKQWNQNKRRGPRSWESVTMTLSITQMLKVPQTNYLLPLPRISMFRELLMISAKLSMKWRRVCLTIKVKLAALTRHPTQEKNATQDAQTKRLVMITKYKTSSWSTSKTNRAQKEKTKPNSKANNQVSRIDGLFLTSSSQLMAFMVRNSMGT